MTNDVSTNNIYNFLIYFYSLVEILAGVTIIRQDDIRARKRHRRLRLKLPVQGKAFCHDG